MGGRFCGWGTPLLPPPHLAPPTLQDASLALQEVARCTARKEVAAASWALSAIPLYRVESVFEFREWWGVAGGTVLVA